MKGLSQIISLMLVVVLAGAGAAWAAPAAVGKFSAVEAGDIKTKGPVADVRAFGAKPNDGGDDTVAIQAALASGAKTVRIPAGTWKITALTIPDNVSLEGEGAGATVLDGSAATYASLPNGMHIATAGGSLTALPALATNVVKNVRTLTFVSAPSVQVNDILCIYNPADYSWSGFRSYYRAGEYLRVAAVAGNTVTLQGSTADDYTAAAVTVYRLDSATTCKLGGFTLKALKDTANPVWGINLRNAVNSSIQDVRVYNASYTQVQVENSVNVAVINVTTQEDFSTNFSGDYGLVIGNSQDVVVTGGYFAASRHGLTIGGGAEVGDVINRHIKVQAATIASSGDSQALDMHGNVEWVTFNNNTIDGGVVIGGDFTQLSGNLIRGDQTNGPVSILGSEFRGANHVITGNTVENAEAATTRGALIDIGGNSEVISASTRKGGVISITDNTLLWGVGTHTSESHMRIAQRGYAGSEPIDVVISNNTVSMVKPGVRGGSIVMQYFSGVMFNTVSVSNNRFIGCGGLHLVANAAGSYCAGKVYVNGNSSSDSYTYGFMVEDVRDLISMKNNTATGARFFAISATGVDATKKCRMVHVSGNTTVDNMSSTTSSSTTNADVIVWYADYAVLHDNVGGNSNEMLTVGSNGAFTIGETITGGTSGATATVRDIRNTNQIMVERSRVGTFTGGETLTGSSSGATTTHTSTGFTTAYYGSLLELGTVWKGNNVNLRGLADYTSAVVANNAI